MAKQGSLFAPDDEVLDETSEQDAVGLVSDQGEDEGDAAPDDATRFDASIAAKDWTVETLVSQMRKGRIDLSPTFQRRNAWLDNRKSKLIESILLGFPIPQIVLAEQPDHPGRFFVLDGKQRLLALRQFFVEGDPRDEGFEKLTLKSLEQLPTLNNFNLERLDAEHSDLLATLENFTIRTVVLGQWNSEKLLLSLFLRLNTGSLPLSPQELRQALIPGGFIQWLDDTSGRMMPMRELLGNSHPDRRMVDAELALRHLAFTMSPLKYRGNLKSFLDGTSKELNESWSDGTSVDADSEMFELAESIQFMLDTLGTSEACRKWSKTRFERAINRAVFDVQAYSFSFSDVRDAAAGKGEYLREAFADACDRNVSFSRSITSTTKTRDAFLVRHKAWAAIIKKTCNITYPLPPALQS